MTVSITDTELIVTRAIRIPLSEFDWTYSRSSGPGGQNVNKVSSKAHLRWNITESPSLPAAVKERFLARYRRRITTEGEFLASSQRYRDQPKNVHDCLEKLGELLLSVSKPPTVRRKTKPSRGAVERRLKQKKENSARKQQRRKPLRDD